jgi:hypothetical protein
LQRFDETQDDNYTTRGFGTEEFTLAVVLLACKNTKNGQTLKGLAKLTDCKEKDMKVLYIHMYSFNNYVSHIINILPLYKIMIYNIDKSNGKIIQECEEMIE